MDELVLNQELYNNIVTWMARTYSINSSKQYSYTLRKICKTYKVLNKETILKIAKHLKYQNERAVISLINRYCFEMGIDFHIIVPRIKSPPIKYPELLSPEEIKLMIESAPKPYDLVIRCIFNMGAGLRISEIIKFSWNHIRWIDWLRDKENYGVAMIKAGKGSKDRPVNIPKNLMKDLYEHAREQRVINEFGIPSGGMIFQFESSRKLDLIYKKELFQNNLEKWKNEYVRHSYNWFRYNVLQKHCEKALNKKIKVHRLRHSRATYLYEYEHVPVEKIQVLLGHSSLNTTMLYTKINPRSVFELIKNTSEI